MSERKSILLRLDPAVHDALARWASDELRSTNAQVEYLLRRALSEAGRLPSQLAEEEAIERTAAAMDSCSVPDGLQVIAVGELVFEPAWRPFPRRRSLAAGRDARQNGA
jgi:hypothetical protein